MIHEILIVPSCGHSGEGVWEPGNRCGVLHEVDVVDAYVHALCDELELQRRRFRVLPTRLAPGIPEHERHQHVEPRQLVVHCRLGWDGGKQPPNNWSSVTFGKSAPNRLARIVTEAVGQWGKCHVYGHEIRNPVRSTQIPLLNVPGAPGVEVRPFSINGRQAHEYARRAKALGRDLAWALGEFLGDEAMLGKIYNGLKPPAAEARTVTERLPDWLLKEIS